MPVSLLKMSDSEWDLYKEFVFPMEAESRGEDYKELMDKVGIWNYTKKKIFSIEISFLCIQVDVTFSR